MYGYKFGLMGDTRKYGQGAYTDIDWRATGQAMSEAQGTMGHEHEESPSVLGGWRVAQSIVIAY
jgi:hypothetical protein